MKAYLICGTAILAIIAGMAYFSGRDQYADLRKQMAVTLPYDLSESKQSVNFSNDSFDNFVSRKNDDFQGETAYFAPLSIQKNLLLNLYKSNIATPKNQYFSPYLTYLNALILKNAAQNEEAKQLGSFFGNEIPQTNALNLAFQVFMQKLPKSFEISSFVWANNINESYAATAKSYFNLNILPMPQSSNHINQWVEKKTNGRFTKLLPINREIKNQRSFIGLFTLFLNTSWHPLYAFDKKKTEQHPFTGLTKEAPVNLMYRSGPADYFENEKLQAVRLPLEDNNTITFILPKAPDFKDFVNKLTVEDIFDLPFKKETILIYLPQIQIRTARDIVPMFKQLGVLKVFDKQTADLSGLSYEKNAFFGHIFHALKFSLTEEALKEADFNEKIDCPTCTKEAQKQFRADKPFLFYISNGILGGIYADAPDMPH